MKKEKLKKVSFKELETEFDRFRPLANRVLVLPDPEKERTVGGIIIPEAAQEKPVKGKIVIVGKEYNAPESLNVGDRILFGKYSGQGITVDKIDYIIMPETEVWAILHEKEEA